MALIADKMTALPLVFYYKFSDPGGSTTAADSGPGGLTAAVHGAVTFASESLTGGVNGTAVALTRDGENGFDVPNLGGINLGGNWAIPLWVTTTDAASSQTLFGAGDKFLRVQSGKITFGSQVGTHPVADGAPHSVILQSTAGQMSVTVDGATDIPTFTDSLSFGYLSPSIGFLTYYGGNGLAGKLQHFALVSRPLTGQEITDLVAAGQQTGPPPPASYYANLSDVSWTAAGTAKVTAGQPTGGSGTYTYAWHLGDAASFTPSSATLVAGQTGRTATFTGLAANVAKWIVCVFGDGQTSATSWHRMLRPSGLAPMQVLQIGDSTVASSSPCLAASATVQNFLSTCLGERGVTVLNAAVSGSSPDQWGPGSGYTNAAVAAVTAAGFTAGFRVCIRLMTNPGQNGVDAATYKTQMQAVIGVWTAMGAEVYLDDGIWREPGAYNEFGTGYFDESIIPRLASYRAMNDELINGTNVFAGDRSSYAIIAQHPAKYLNRNTDHPGGIHPSDAGRMIMDLAVGKALLARDATPPLTSTPPAVTDVRAGVTYTINGSGAVGTYDPIAGRYTDPGIAHVEAGQTYKFAGTSLVGTLVATDADAGLTLAEVSDEVAGQLTALETRLRAGEPLPANILEIAGSSLAGTRLREMALLQVIPDEVYNGIAARTWANNSRTMTAFGFNVALTPGGLDQVMVDGLNARQALAIACAGVSGIISGPGAETGTGNFTITVGGVARLNGTMAADARTAVTVHPPT